MKHDTRPKPFVFVLMPFRSEFNDIYEIGIKEACNNVGAYCERVDEQIFEERILDRIYNQIAKADVIISDMTGKNPNVFYETGYAHALGKRVILITQIQDDIPFDLKHFQHIIYGGKIKYLRDSLEKRVEWAIQNPNKNDDIISTAVEYLIQGVEVKEGAVSYILEHFDNETKNLERTLQIDILNISDRSIDPDQIQLSILLECYSGRDASLMPDGTYLHRVPIKEEIYPGSNLSHKINLHIPQGIDHAKLHDPGVKAVINEHTKYGRMIKTMTLKLITQEKFEIKTHNKDLNLGTKIKFKPNTARKKINLL